MIFNLKVSQIDFKEGQEEIKKQIKDSQSD